jgi:transglutaminase-like putative cysteine protease
MKKTGLFILFSILPALLISCGAGQRISHFKDITGLKNMPGPEDHPGQPAVILLNTGSRQILYLQKDLKSILRRQRVVKILTEEGLGYGQVEFITSPFQTISKIKGRLIHPDGESVKLSKEMLVVEPAVADDVYSDMQRISLDLPVQVGSIIDLEWEEKHEGSVLFSETWWFQEELPTVFSRFSLSVDPTWEYSQRQFNTRVEPRLDTSESDYQTEAIYTISWEKRNIDPLPTETAMPSPYDLKEGIAIIFNQDVESFRPGATLIDQLYEEFEDSPAFSVEGKTVSNVRKSISQTIVNFISWNDVAIFYNDRTTDTRRLNQTMEDRITELTAGKTSHLDRVKAIYEFVRLNFQFYDHDFGLKGYAIAPAEEVYKSKYGDTAELSNLLVTLLGGAGIECYPVLARSIDRGGLKNYPSIKQFNRVMVAVPLPAEGQILWLDPSFRNGRFGFIPWDLQGINALVIKGDIGEFFQTPVFPVSANIAFCKVAESIDQDGAISGTATINLTGNEAFAVRRDLRQAEQNEQENIAAETLREILPGSALDQFEISNLDLDEENLVLTFGFSFAADGARADDGSITLDAGIFNVADDLSPFTAEYRDYDILFPYMKSKVVKVTLNLPEGYAARSLPEPWELSTPYADYATRFFSNGPTIFCEKSFTIKTLQVPKDDYERFRDLSRRIIEEATAKIVIDRAVS